MHIKHILLVSGLHMRKRETRKRSRQVSAGYTIQAIDALARNFEGIRTTANSCLICADDEVVFVFFICFNSELGGHDGRAGRRTKFGRMVLARRTRATPSLVSGSGWSMQMAGKSSPSALLV
jgi:hypothetical protein